MYTFYRSVWEGWLKCGDKYEKIDMFLPQPACSVLFPLYGIFMNVWQNKLPSLAFFPH